MNWESIARAHVHPLRVQIAERVASAPDQRFSPSDLAGEFGAPLGNVSYHVGQLLTHGLLARAGRATRRGAVEHYYRAAGQLLGSP
jgi:predicted transcriptional regulator